MDVERVDMLQEEPEVGCLDLDVFLDQLRGARARRLDLDDVHADLDLNRLEVDVQLLERDVLRQDLAANRSKRHKTPALWRDLARLTNEGTLRKPRASRRRDAIALREDVGLFEGRHVEVAVMESSRGRLGCMEGTCKAGLS